MSPNVKNLQNGQKLWYNYDLSGFTGSAAFHFRNSILAMIKTSTIKFVVVFASLLLGTIAVPAQTTRPLLQDIKIYKPEPTPSEGSLVKPIGSSAAIATTPVNAVRTMFPLLAEQTIPGYSGILVETMDGGVVVESNSSALFNPASNVKLATAYAVLKTFGPDFRFATNVYTNGTLDRTTGTLTGNLYVSGKDPVFNYEHAILIANELNRRGIRSITGDIIVTNDFVMNYSGSSQYAANTLLSTLDLAKRSPSAARAWVDYLNNSGRAGMFQNLPSVSVTGTAS
ncbi:MAG: D-alanyl-D-alanine carboxypeptidase, partial [Acidobacteria bacterium]|nr:D-alanyl-D-alanine carboxypeptidase [Acidobacteriota bacterium]